MPDICIGFEVHQPYRLNRFFVPDRKVRKKELEKLYFDEMNREVLDRVSQKCYIPATKIVLEKLDEGFSCAFSISGTLLEQLEKWQPDALALFDQIARHRNAELLGQTYYHSIAGCFYDKSEFMEQVRMHADLMHDLFRIRPTFFENTEFTFNNAIAACVREMDYYGIFTEGVDRILGWRSPDYLYSCQDLPVLLRNVRLSDDIAFRFGNRSWDKYPLTADTYAGWLAGVPGDVVSIFIDFETFGEHFWQETGILDFLHSLPEEMAARGVNTILPSQVPERFAVQDAIDVPHTISWADIEKDASAWMGTDRQRLALSAIQKAKTYAVDKDIWRYLQTSDHFYYMASKYGTCGEVHAYFSHHGADDAFRTYMKVLADFESRSIRFMKNKRSAKTLRTLTPEEAFWFAGPEGSAGHAAYNLDQFLDLLPVVPADTVRFHQERGDFSTWAEQVLEDKKLAAILRETPDPAALITAVREHKEQLWSHLT
jgi:alpha-amylase